MRLPKMIQKRLDKAAALTDNLDCMEPDDLMEVWVTIHHHPRAMAARLFPERPPGYVSAARALGNYAANKAPAVSCRLKGQIQAAQVYEFICDRIYSSIPDFARW